MNRLNWSSPHPPTSCSRPPGRTARKRESGPSASPPICFRAVFDTITPGIWQGITAGGNGTITTNCVIANHGMLGLATNQTNSMVLGNFFFNNGWRHYTGDVTEGACWMGGNCADITLAGNVFSNNWGVAI